MSDENCPGEDREVRWTILYMDGFSLQKLVFRAHCAECASHRFARQNRGVRVLTVMPADTTDEGER